jgi:hypothetical protein
VSVPSVEQKVFTTRGPTVRAVLAGAERMTVLYTVSHYASRAATLLTLAGYTLVFAHAAVRYFRWAHGSCESTGVVSRRRRP